jgi:hypothetical protein
MSALRWFALGAILSGLVVWALVGQKRSAVPAPSRAAASTSAPALALLVLHSDKLASGQIEVKPGGDVRYRLDTGLALTEAR